MADDGCLFGGTWSDYEPYHSSHCVAHNLCWHCTKLNQEAPPSPGGGVGGGGRQPCPQAPPYIHVHGRRVWCTRAHLYPESGYTVYSHNQSTPSSIVCLHMAMQRIHNVSSMSLSERLAGKQKQRNLPQCLYIGMGGLISRDKIFVVYACLTHKNRENFRIF